ncbi:hypothetical protein KPK_2290 [Klebsiella variicola]|uniref:Uncharacterized protein n=1 Tax=Klebsiella variicola (strain 342) TaxID=507522 RepID=B5XWG0_KLEV3|nr:hypothetical protein KPK_2290 [Klebsiella variicola]
MVLSSSGRLLSCERHRMNLLNSIFIYIDYPIFISEMFIYF